MGKRWVLIMWFLWFITPGNYAQVSDTSHSLLQDQNPNHHKSKDKYTKTTTVPPNDKQPVLLADTPKVLTSHTVTPTDNKTELTTYLKNLKTAEINHDRAGVSNALSSLGNYYLKNNELSLALEYYQKALVIHESLADKKPTLETLNRVADIYRRQKNTAQAEVYYQRLLSLAQRLNDAHYIKQAGDALSEIFATKGNYKNAYEMSQLLKQVTDSLTKNETRQKLLQTRFSYDSLKQVEAAATYRKGILQKQSEIESSKKISWLIAIGMALALLLAFSFYRGFQNTKKANHIIASQKQETEEKKELIESSLREKEILLKEIHHRVKNNLQIVSSLLNLQANRTDSEELKRTINEAKNRISSMALIHQKMYQSGNVSSIDFQAYIEQMAQSMDATFNTHKKEISYHINTHNIILDIDTSIPLGLIINELLTNSYKYAFAGKESGNITINLQEKNNTELELHISDDGTGLPANFDMNTLNSLGLKLVKGLSNQLKGTIRFENDHGTHCFITFKNPLLT